MALAIPVAAIVMSGLQKMWRLRLEEAKLRIHGGQSGSSEEVQALRSELETLQRQLSELNERVDFTERLLARGRNPDSNEQIRPPA
jgi:ABC-type phosphate transport system auxiliary subunit